MKVESFKFGFSASTAVLSNSHYASKILPFINSFSSDGNVFYVHYHSGRSFPGQEVLGSYGRLCGNRFIEKRLPAYSEERHFEELLQLKMPTFFISKETISDDTNPHVKILKVNSPEFNKYTAFFCKQEPFEIPLNKLGMVIENTVGGMDTQIEIRDPYLNKHFLAELMDRKIFDNAHLKLHFSVTDTDLWRSAGEEWILDTKYYQETKWESISENKKKYINKKLIEYADKYVASLFSEKNEQDAKNRFKALLKSKQLQLLFYRLKLDHYEHKKYSSDRAAHWHHRYIKITQNSNTFSFESSHSFIHKNIQRHWYNEGETLHFRQAKNEEFAMFADSFEAPVTINPYRD